MVRFGGGNALRGANVTLRNNSNRGDARQHNYTRNLMILAIAGVAFYTGVMTGMHATSKPVDCSKEALQKEAQNKIDAMVRERVSDALAQQRERARPEFSGNPEPRFGKTTARFAHGLAKTTKKEFLELYDYGLPESYDDSGATEALILYNSKAALPSNQERAHAATYDEGLGIPLLTAHEATENCDVMNVVTTQAPGGVQQCLAVVGNYESFHLQRWMRIEEGRGRHLDSTKPLRHVSRGMQTNGADQFHPPSNADITSHWKLLKTYFDSLEETVAALTPILKKIVKKNTIVVMVVNFGQSTLLTNFVCSSKARGFDLSNVLLFATDEKTLKLAEGLGLATFYDEKNFAELPTKEAANYGDRAFVAMMYAKVVTVQLVNMLKYDVLFQDVDMVWYKDPLEVFHDTNSELNDYDILFQDDGARSVRYAPYCANSGFYYVRYNPRTLYLFTSLLYSGDLIMATNSHQQALNALLTEHSSLYGLKVKTLKGADFPGGFHYHRRRDLMKTITNGSYTPWIFHMSWTKNKDNKLLFFRQMGLWYVKDQCIDEKAISSLGTVHSDVEKFVSTCCSQEPLISCHYKDKPSTIPCNTSPAIDKGGRSFWP